MKRKKSDAAGLSEEAKGRLLKQLRVFRSLSAGEIAVTAERSEWRMYRTGETVFDRGSDRLYAVRDGEIRITKPAADGREITLASYVENESFGELSLFENDGGDTAARCESDATLLLFPVGGADSFLAEHPAISAKLLSNLLALVARRIRSTNRLIAEKTPWAANLRRTVMTDKLTGLYNGGYLEDDLAGILDADPEGTSLLMIKPDNFKTFNDTYGHDAGDRVLRIMASRLRSLAGRGNVPIRYRGDVFAVVITDSNPGAACAAAEKIRKAMGRLDLSIVTHSRAPGRKSTGDREAPDPSIPQSKPRIEVSVGLAACPGSNAADMVELAYKNLFAARELGGNRTYGCRSEA